MCTTHTKTKKLCKIINIFFENVLGAQKDRLIETFLLSTHNICFGCSKEENNFSVTNS